MAVRVPIQEPRPSVRLVTAVSGSLDAGKTFPTWLTLSWAWEQTMDDPGATMAAIGSNLRRLREQRGIAQKSLAELSQTGVGTLKAIESAKLLPGIELILSLARTLDVPCTDFLEPPHAPTRPPKDATWPIRPRRALQSALGSAR